MKHLLILALLIPLYTFSQKVSFKIVTVKTTLPGHISYPLVIYHDKQVERKINNRIRKLLLNDVKNVSLREQLKEWGVGIYDVHHTVTFNRNYLLSFDIYVEGCGAYCSSFKRYFNFDLKTGKVLEWREFFQNDKNNAFEKVLNTRIIKDRKHFKDVILKELTKDRDSITYDNVVEDLNSCPNLVGQHNYSLYPDRIELITNCHFVHAIRAFEPNNSFVYTRKQLRVWIKEKYYNQLFK